MSATMSSRGLPKQIDKNALLVAQEITFAKILSGNDPKIRERGVKRLRNWLMARSSSSCPFKENDLKRIWKGLFYCMWMSDKPLIQEEVAENISKLVHCFKNTKAFICFVKCFFLTMAVEWRGLDNWRMDKFLMFVRRFMRQVFIYCDQQSWPLKLVNELGAVFNCTILPNNKALSENVHPPVGFSIHFVDVCIDELTKVTRGHLQNDDLLVALLRPFALYLSESPEKSVSTEIVSQIFDRLIEQSTEGHKFREKFEAWKQLGFPRGNIDAVERVETGSSDEEVEDESENDEKETPLDPRAGGVNVELPVANYRPEVVVNLLCEYRHAKTSTVWSRKVIARLMSRFNALTEGKYPLGIKKVDKVPKINFKKLAKKSARELLEFRDRIMNEDDDEWIESIQDEKLQKKGRNKSAQKKSTQSDEDDESEQEEDDYGSDDDIDEDGDIEEEEEEGHADSDEDGDVSVDEDDDVDAEEEEGDADSDEDGEVDINGDGDADSDEYGDDDIVDEDDVSMDDDADESEDDGADVQVGNGINVDDGLIEQSDVSEKEDDKLKSEVNEEAVKVTPGKRNKNKQNKFLIGNNTPEKQKPKNLPQVIPSSPNKNQKNKQASEEVTPQKKMPKNSPRVIENGINKSPKKQLKSENAKKDENVIIVGRKRKLAEALSTPLIHRGKHLKSVQNSPKTPQTPGSAKRVHFILQRNTAQATSEYDKILRENPGNPYDSAKKPRFSVLKSTPLASPVNPFYKP